MVIRNEKEIIALIQADNWMMDILMAAKSLELPDWWVCAGFVRSKIWDELHHVNKRTPMPDIDVIYFDNTNIDEEVEKKYEHTLQTIAPNIPWSVKNQARMHVINNLSPYHSSVDAISKFPETVTALGLTLDDNDNLVLTAPHGIKDLLQMEVKPTPLFKQSPELAEIYEDRIVKKNWVDNWKKVKVYHI